MRRETVTYDCDVCSDEIDQSDPMSIIQQRVPVLFTTNQIDGIGCEPYWSFDVVDLCGECAKKSFGLHGSGCQGTNTYTVREQ